VLWGNPELIDEFLQDKNNGTDSDEERQIIAKWRQYFVINVFMVVSHLEKYTICVDFDEEEPKFYGVVGIYDSLEEIYPEKPPYIVLLTLLPFKGKIIYDSYVIVYHNPLTPHLLSMAQKLTKLSQTTDIIESFETEDGKYSHKQANKRKTPPKPIKIIGNEDVPQAIAVRYNEIASIITKFWNGVPNKTFKKLSLRALAKLSRTPPSPITYDSAISWAAGISFAIGTNNFIFDKSQPYYLSMKHFTKKFDISKSSIISKSVEVTKLLNLSIFSKEFTIEDFTGFFTSFPTF
jgi:hypothetical protein